ncbi:BON domain-containing protein [Lignipirellula cremea]|uniref:BON domain protein n=1 Tax=Lignipirellula cremea TaxID=2528010 RepID=A0A518DYH3_9BACT|nr:BON domain-containing protein [Lignipirellula cremea]QDU96845.1 BON domain protein [Lignipirellula cremea]
MRITTLALLTVAGLLWFAPAASAQSTTGGTFGNRTFGDGVSSGRNAVGGRTSGQAGTQAGATTQAMSDVGQVTGNERFIRENRDPGAFVGSDAGDVSNVRSQLGGQFGLGGLGNLGGRNQTDFRAENAQTSQGQRTVRAPLRLGFAPLLAPAPVVSARMEQRYLRLPGLDQAGQIAVAMQGRTAVLTGVVASEHARNLAARIALLEPGVSSVQNDLTVGAAPVTGP